MPTAPGFPRHDGMETLTWEDGRVAGSQPSQKLNRPVDTLTAFGSIDGYSNLGAEKPILVSPL